MYQAFFQKNLWKIFGMNNFMPSLDCKEYIYILSFFKFGCNQCLNYCLKHKFAKYLASTGVSMCNKLSFKKNSGKYIDRYI